MSTALRIQQTDPDQEAMTPQLGRIARRSVFWVVIGATLLVVTVLLTVVVRGTGSGVPLGADNPAPKGAMALAEVLRQQGVTVVETTSLAATEDALRGSEASTILLWDMDMVLDDDQHRRLLRATDDLVVLDPSFLELENLTPGVVQAGFSDRTITADCDVTAVVKAGSVSATGSTYRILDATDATGCLSDGDRYGLVETRTTSGTVTVLGLIDALSNERIGQAGNAALALNLLGQHEMLVWYVPGLDDLDDQAPPSINDLTPPWLTPFVVMLVIVVLGGILWRSRRVGPLVVENLPVIVRASETMEGRARLYERSDSRQHALDALRIGAVARLARISGLSRTATVTEIVDAVAALTGRDRTSVADVLVDALPTTDSELVHLSDQLLRLESEAAQRSRPEWTS